MTVSSFCPVVYVSLSPSISRSFQLWITHFLFSLSQVIREEVSLLTKVSPLKFSMEKSYPTFEATE